MVELENGTEAWLYEDQIVQTVRGNTRTRPGYDDDPLGVAWFSEMRPGCYNFTPEFVVIEEPGCLLEGWCATDPQRLIPLIVVPLWDPAAAAVEVHRTAALGARAVAFSENPTTLM